MRNVFVPVLFIGLVWGLESRFAQRAYSAGLRPAIERARQTGLPLFVVGVSDT